MKKIIICMMMILTSTVSGWAQETEVINNAKVLEYLEKGWHFNLIQSKIEKNESSININDDDFITEVNKKMPELAEWLMNSYNPHASISSSSLAPGIYWVSPNGEYKNLNANVFKKEESVATKIINKGKGIVRSIGFAGILGIPGIGSILDFDKSFDLYKASLNPSFKSEKLVIDNPTSNTKLRGDQNTNPQFVFNLSGSISTVEANNDKELLAMMMKLNQILSKNFTPKDFKCVKLDRKKNCRSLPAGLSFEPSGIFISKEEKVTSVSKKRFVDFTTTMQSNGTYLVTFDEALEAGEYCFVLEKFEEAEAQMCYDFTIE